MNFNALDTQLRETAADMLLTNTERDELRQLGAILDPERVRFMRNRAFDMVREILLATPSRDDQLQALKWLELVVKALDPTQNQPRIEAQAYFSPDDDCGHMICELCRSARSHLDVCVFTISDNRLSNALIAYHRRGVTVRVITDSEKQYDAGSDIENLRKAGIPLRIDNTDYHMHHKFALFDRRILLNGSFNWTHAASRHNQENILTTDNPALVTRYLAQFDIRWQRYA